MAKGEAILHSGFTADSPKGRAALDFLAGLGLVAGQWASLELALDINALALARILTPAGLCFTAQVIGSARKLDAYVAVARLRGAERFMGQLNEFAKEATALAERRNRAVHDSWSFVGKDIPTRLEITARRKLRVEHIPMTKDELVKLVNDIQDMIFRFIQLHESIMASLES